jgi:hypothetical protein
LNVNGSSSTIPHIMAISGIIYVTDEAKIAVVYIINVLNNITAKNEPKIARITIYPRLGRNSPEFIAPEKSANNKYIPANGPIKKNDKAAMAIPLIPGSLNFISLALMP